MYLLSPVCQQTADGVEQLRPEEEKGLRFRQTPKEKVPPMLGGWVVLVVEVVGDTKPWIMKLTNHAQ
jgi:hypothetical protein